MEKISSAFPWVNFYLSAFTVSDNFTTFYKDSDICIYCDNTDQYFKNILSKNEYYVKSLCSTPLYIWVAKDSPLLEADNITFHHLRKYPISILRNTLNGIDFSTFLHSNLLHTVSTKINLKKNIKNFEHYTIDLLINRGHFIFEDIFDKNEFTLLKTGITFYFVMLAKKSVSLEYLEEIEHTFLSLINEKDN